MKLDGSYVLQPSFSIQYRGSLLHCQIYKGSYTIETREEVYLHALRLLVNTHYY